MISDSNLQKSELSCHELAKICECSYKHVTLNLHDCEAVILFLKDVQVVAFRGTETGSLFKGRGIIDVIRDMRILPWYDIDMGWVHSGFLKGARKSAQTLEKILIKDMPVVLTGHSLGGALSLLCAAKLQAAGFNVLEWVGFGSPKAQLSKRILQGFKQTNYRYRNDVVPLMPRIPLYRHNYPVILIKPDCSVDSSATWDDHDISIYIKETDGKF